MIVKITYKPFGDRAILIEWPSSIDNNTLKDILLFKEKIRSNKCIDSIDLIQGYASLTIIYKTLLTDFEIEVSLLKSIYTSFIDIKKQEYFVWEIPVCYDISFGIDLEEISRKKQLSISEIITLHAQPLYTVFFIGFVPGFPYLSGLHQQLFLDRKPTPRLKVSEGAVGIGGKQTGIYPQDISGGWNIIGKTPISFFDIKNTTPCFIRAGDFIKFKSITIDEFFSIKNDVKNGKFTLKSSLYD